VLDGMTLQFGLWKNVAESVRQHLPMKTMQMNQLFRGFEGPWAKENLKWMDYFHDVGNCIFQNDPDPFSVTEGARYPQDLTSSRSYDYYYPQCSLGSE